MASPGRALDDGTERHEVALYGLEATLSRTPLAVPLDIATGAVFTEVLEIADAARHLVGPHRTHRVHQDGPGADPLRRRRHRV